MTNPTGAQLDRQAQIDAVNQELGYHLQAAGLAVNPADAYSTPEDYRRAQVRRLQEALPPTVHGALRARLSPAMYATTPEVTDRIERGVLATTLKVAHQAPDMREIVTTDATGREITEFVGGRMGWMSQYKAPVQLMRRLGSTVYCDT